MKKILWFFTVFMLCVCIMSVSVFAADDPIKDKFFPDGAPAMGLTYLDDDSFDNGHSTYLHAYTMLPEVLTAFGMYIDTAEDFNAEFGMYAEPTVYMQYDVAIDDPNGWRVKPEWNWDKPSDGDSHYDPVAYNQSGSYESRLYVMTFFDLYHEELRAELDGLYTAKKNEYGDDYYRFDFENHTVYVRSRYVVEYEYEETTGTRHYIVSPWSETYSVGKNGTQKPLVEPTGFEAPIISDLVVVPPGEYDSEAHIKYDMEFPDSLYDAYVWYTVSGNWTDVGDLEGQLNVDNKGWQDLYVGNAGWMYDGERLTTSTEMLTKESRVEFRVRWSNDYFASPWSNVLSVNAPTWETSEWATAEIAQADALGLIPDSLKEADLTAPITRAEFAAVAVKAYEALSGTAALPNTINPFKDTTDIEVLKAYNLGITTGVSADKFEPATLLNREQAATMLTRTFKRATMNGWTIQTDASFPLTYEMPVIFADDKDISDWAKDSVYFMAANGIINGVGNNNFAPKNVTTQDEATGYANATREQALIIAVRMVENLKK